MSSARRVPDRELLRRSSADKEVPVPSAPADARCTFCDHHLVPDARFCPKCGHLRSPRSPEVRQAWPEASWTVRTRRLERGGWAGEVEFGKAPHNHNSVQVWHRGPLRTFLPEPMTRDQIDWTA
eukprot:g28255.t1